jgi:hypothetical protein
MFSPTIDGLTIRQVQLLDIMWSIQTLDEAREWMETLDSADYLDALTLMELLELEGIDYELQHEKSFGLANDLINRIKML